MWLGSAVSGKQNKRTSEKGHDKSQGGNKRHGNKGHERRFKDKIRGKIRGQSDCTINFKECSLVAID